MAGEKLTQMADKNVRNVRKYNDINIRSASAAPAVLSGETGPETRPERFRICVGSVS